MLNLPDNKRREGLGFSPSTKDVKTSASGKPDEGVFRRAGFLHSPSEANAVIEDNSEEVLPSFVTPGRIHHNWTSTDVPSIIPMLK